jgi:hypothetical protein
MRFGIDLLIGVLAVLLFAETAAPETRLEPHNAPQMSAVETDCDTLTGAARGLCIAYCESLDCDVEDHPRCERLRRTYERMTGGARLPCVGISFGQCLESSDDLTECNELGGQRVSDSYCPAVTSRISLGCITSCSDEGVCRNYHPFFGVVGPTVSDCPGGLECFASFSITGRCVEDRCPHIDDEIEYLDVDNVTGDVSFRNLNDGRTYECTVGFDSPDDGFDCLADPRVGDVAVVRFRGLRDVVCEIDFKIAIDTVPGSPTECEYTCDGL